MSEFESADTGGLDPDEPLSFVDIETMFNPEVIVERAKTIIAREKTGETTFSRDYFYAALMASLKVIEAQKALNALKLAEDAYVRTAAPGPPMTMGDLPESVVHQETVQVPTD